MSRSHARKARLAPGFDVLEEKVVLSAAAAPHALGVMPTALVKGVTYLYLTGTMSGKYSVSARPVADAGKADVLSGAGNLNQVGHASISGKITGTGFIANGHASGALKVVNAKGSFTLELTGPPSGGFSGPDSGTYTYTIKGLTGAYKKAFGTGKVDVTLADGKFSLSFHGDPNRF
ncbi:MAG: hypothetical protein U0835_02660 [Isosphaeraceae bacterium]